MGEVVLVQPVPQVEIKKLGATAAGASGRGGAGGDVPRIVLRATGLRDDIRQGVIMPRRSERPRAGRTGGLPVAIAAGRCGAAIKSRSPRIRRCARPGLTSPGPSRPAGRSG
jgi:hypothetical protein